MAGNSVTVVDVDAETFPPSPDPAVVVYWRTRMRRDGAEAAGTPPPEIRAAGSQHVVLHTRTSRLAFHATDWRTPAPTFGACTRRDWEAYFGPGACFRPGAEQWSQPVPDILRWVIDSGAPERPYLTAPEAQAFLESLTGLAQFLIDHLLPIQSTTEVDWSPDSASAGLDIQLACRRDDQPVQGRRPFLIGMDEAVNAWPALVRPHWADLDPEALTGEAAAITQFGVAQQPALQKVFSRQARHGPLQILGARAWLFAHHGRARSAKPGVAVRTPGAESRHRGDDLP